MIDPATLNRLGAGRWTVPLMALLAERDGERFAAMLPTLGIARDSLARTLSHVVESGWVVRNSGYGHPLRPEYVLTEAGRPVGSACVRMMRARALLDLPADALPRWSLPILGRLDAGWARFSDLRADLVPVTSRALSLNLKQMIGTRLIGRRLEDGFPPSPLYGLQPPGLALMESLRR